ncbi:MAG: cyclic nucleotide-binding domain-containing protein [Candidatus Lindowbacteria bacterium]|nr:cyclic nucleotide-binding domain-containing protein [Candidatus Lindowbacteria bacterium]
MVVERIIADFPGLKDNSFFADLSDGEIQELVKVCTVHTFRPGEYALREHEESQHILIILTGKIRIGKTLYAGDEKELGFLEAGNFFGEMAFIDENPRSASALCVEETTLLKIERDSFEKLASKKPVVAYKVAMKIARSLSQRLRASNDVVEGFFSNPNKAIVEFKTRLMKIQAMLMR